MPDWRYDYEPPDMNPRGDERKWSQWDKKLDPPPKKPWVMWLLIGAALMFSWALLFWG